jgi:phosphatidylserine decarboxylase
MAYADSNQGVTIRTDSYRHMNTRTLRSRILELDHVNFILTNYWPRRWLTRIFGRFSKIEHPLVGRASVALWKLFSDLDLSDARTTHFRSVHDCFTRQLRDGARPVDPDPRLLVSPSDGVVGAHGCVNRGRLLQVKGSQYSLRDLLGSNELANHFDGGQFVTLRLKSSMYHRFHAPHDCRVEQVIYFHGDVWNVNPQTLKRVDRLFCRNERAVVLTRLPSCNAVVALVPVAAILVASIKLHFLETTLHMNYDGPSVVNCDACIGRGEEMGWFEHGSTIIVIAPRGFQIVDTLGEGDVLRMGEPLMKVPSSGREVVTNTLPFGREPIPVHEE